MKKLTLLLSLILTNLFSTNIATASSLYMITGVDDTGTTSGHVKKIGPKKWEYCDNYTKAQIRNTYIRFFYDGNPANPQRAIPVKVSYYATWNGIQTDGTLAPGSVELYPGQSKEFHPQTVTHQAGQTCLVVEYEYPETEDIADNAIFLLDDNLKLRMEWGWELIGVNWYQYRATYKPYIIEPLQTSAKWTPDVISTKTAGNITEGLDSRLVYKIGPEGGSAFDALVPEVSIKNVNPPTCPGLEVRGGSSGAWEPLDANIITASLPGIVGGVTSEDFQFRVKSEGALGAIQCLIQADVSLN
ncbi:hypothetical protein FFT88_23345 [Escherichia sp. E4930]|uniref:Fimbrial protein n=1 Tax=Escherichia marmotae TaxID=1499973 RepID=A0A7W3APS3_9ESCH|nr:MULTISPECIES: hypothetical protein [Escherichia]MBA7901205.1 hypothetical protein [Escherichia marmotae]QLW52936.1 hypothetical protein HV246_23985 [Escherichia marmotae]TGB72776.1 hypothetical protein CRG96_00460 [Escherichia sp. E4930]TLU77065.1 hypothetical protein FFT88_23345 [Escherichia sp. E4930]